MVVLVRRFDPTGEELPRWEVLARDADGHPEFFSPPAATKDALAPPSDADLHVGDLIVTVPAEAISEVETHASALYVVTPDGVKAAPKPPEELLGPWLAAWNRNAQRMFWASSRVNRKRIVMAACDCAETVVDLVREGEMRPLKAIRIARAWCFGRASTKQVFDAYGDAWASAGVMPYPNYAAAYAGFAACDKATRVARSASEVVSYAATAAQVAGRMSGVEASDALAPLVERWIPLPVALLSKLGYPDAIPFDPSMASSSPRTNPSPRRRRNSR